jgi:hypothetical protein
VTLTQGAGIQADLVIKPAWYSCRADESSPEPLPDE